MKFIKSILNLFCIMFTVTNITYALFDLVLDKNAQLADGTFQSLGLALIFTLSIALLDYFSNFVKILNSKLFIVIQYLVLLLSIVPWAIYFRWGDWSNIFYVIIFILIFTIIYFVVYYMLSMHYKKSDDDLSKRLKKYQKNIEY